MAECPHCHNRHIPLSTKFWPVPNWTLLCPTCEREVGVAPVVYGVYTVGLIAMLIGSWCFPEGTTKWIIIGAALGISLLAAWIVPLAKRESKKYN
jgi:hypothetical protein